MALVFNCEHCGESIAVRFLKTGEMAKCRKCQKVTPVPPDAAIEPDDAVRSLRSLPDRVPAEVSPDRSPAKGEGLTGVPRLIRNLLVVGLIQILVMSVYINTGGTSAEIMGSRVLAVGNSRVVVTPGEGLEFLDGDEAAERFGEEPLLFALNGDPADGSEEILIIADHLMMEGYTRFEDLERLILQESDNSVISHHIGSEYLSVTWLSQDFENDLLYVHGRFLKAYPYYVRLRAYYRDGPEPSEAVLKALECVEITARW